MSDDPAPQIPAKQGTREGELAPTVGFDGETDPILEELVRHAGRVKIDDFCVEPECDAALQRLLAAGIISDSGAASSANAVPFTPRQIDQYELLERIAGGGMGEVFLARHRLLRRMVAIKLIRPDLHLKQEAVTRFLKEIRALGKLHHRHIVQALDANEHEGLPYLVMEHVNGQSLSHLEQTARQAKQPIPVARVCDFVRQAALGLQAAHDSGIIHRDIKPSNLILDDEGVVKILDLGLAKATEALAPPTETESFADELTREGQVMGTPDYMAPEQLRDSRQTNERTDIYALGATLYKLLTGRAPFADESHATLTSKVLAIGTERATEVNELRADVPVELSALISEMLEKSPELRPATAQKVYERLAPFCVPQALESTAVSTPPPRWGKRIALAAAAACLLFAAVIVFRTRDGEILVELGEGVPETIQIEFNSNSGRALIADQQAGWQIDATPRDYQVKIMGANDQLVLDRQSVRVERDQLVRVKVTLRPVMPGVLPADEKASMTGTDWTPLQNLGPRHTPADSAAVVSEGASARLDSRELMNKIALITGRNILARDMSIRGNIRLVAGDSCSIRTRFNSSRDYYAATLTSDRKISLRRRAFVVDPNTELTLATVDLPPAKADGSWDLELSSVGPLQTITVNGIQLIQQEDKVLMMGRPAITTFNASAEFNQVEVRVLDGLINDYEIAKMVIEKGGQVADENDIYKTLAELPKQIDVVSVMFFGNPATDEDVARIAQLRYLTVLAISNSSVTDVGLASLSQNRQLAALDVQNSKITGAGMQCLAGQPILRVLWANKLHIRDADLAFLTTLPKIEELGLGHPDITDACIPTLAKLKTLKKLNVSGTSMSHEGVEKLGAELGIKVYFEGPAKAAN